MALYYTETEMILISRMNMHQLATWLQKSVKSYGWRAPDKAMDILNALQRALASYAKTHSYDATQEKMLAIHSKIEKWIRLAFFESIRKTLLSETPDLVFRPKALKSLQKQRWEAFWLRRRY